MAPDANRESSARQRMTEAELTLDAQQRDIVERTIAEHSQMRGWYLHAVACRAQHVHVVLTASDCAADDVLRQLKAWCTHRLKEHLSTCEARRETLPGSSYAAQSSNREKWWTQGGSRRSLYDDNSLTAAIAYVREGQDSPRLERG